MIQAKLVYMNSQQTMTALTLPPHGASIGRGSGCTVVTADALVSHQHAILKRIKNTWYIEDQHSTNGTTVNGIRISAAAPLTHLDVITCGSLQLRFMLVTGSEQATLGGRNEPASSGAAGDFPALRSEIARLKKEGDELREKLEQEGRELAGANAENRQLRQAQDDLRSRHAVLRREQEEEHAALTAAQATLRAVAAERELQKKRLHDQNEQLRGLSADLAAQSEARHQADLEAQRLKARLDMIEAASNSLVRSKEAVLDVANQRQLEMDALRRARGDWEREKSLHAAEQRVSAERIQQLMASLDEQAEVQRKLQKELTHLQQRYEEKNTQHRGLRSEYEQLNAEFERHRERARLQSERLAKDKQALHDQLQALQLDAERVKKQAGAESQDLDPQLVAEFSQSHQALTRESESLMRSLTAALRAQVAASKTSPADPAGLKVRDAVEQARAHAEQVTKLLQQLANGCGPLLVQPLKTAC